MDGFQRNMDAVHERGDIDVSAEQLSRRLNKELSKDFVNNPSSGEFYSDRNALPAQYPLLLLTNVGTEFVLNEFKKFVDVKPNGKHLTYLYVQDTNKNAQLLGRADLNLNLLNIINYYTVNYVYYESKGKVVEIDRAKLIDFAELNPQIDPGENAPVYGTEGLKRPQIKLDLSNYDSILDMLSSGSGVVGTSENQSGVWTDETTLDIQSVFATALEMTGEVSEEVNTDEDVPESSQGIESAEWGV